MTVEDTLARLEALEREATPGPWDWGIGTLVTSYEPLREWERVQGAGYEATAQDDADGTLMAEARTALPALLAVARAAETVYGIYNGYPGTEALGEALAALGGA